MDILSVIEKYWIELLILFLLFVVADSLDLFSIDKEKKDEKTDR